MPSCIHPSPLSQLALSMSATERYRAGAGSCASIDLRLRRMRVVRDAGLRNVGDQTASFERTGKVNEKMAPVGCPAAARNCPPCASTIDRQIDRPIPNPAGLVV
jgi:hypothetical protein